MMKKLFTILISLVFLGITFSQSFASCEDFSRYSLSNSNLRVQYILLGGQSGTVNASSGSSSVLTPNTTESIRNISKPIYTTFSGDYLILQGTLEVLAVGDSMQDNPNAPVISNVSAPIIQLSNNSDYESYCEDLGFFPNSQAPTYLAEYMPPSTTSLTPRLASYTFTLKCHRHQNFPFTRDYYRINFYVGFNNFYNDGYSANTPYRITVIFREYSLNVSNTCTNEQIIDSIDSISDSVIDVGDKLDSIGDFIGDSSVSGSVLGAESFLSRADGSYYGLEDFVQAPIYFLQSLISDSACTPLSLPPILGSTITLPCFSDWLYNFNPAIFNLYKMVLYFYIAYLICSDLIRFIKNLRDPQNDNITIIDI